MISSTGKVDFLTFDRSLDGPPVDPEEPIGRSTRVLLKAIGKDSETLNLLYKVMGEEVGVLVRYYVSPPSLTCPQGFDLTEIKSLTAEMITDDNNNQISTGVLTPLLTGEKTLKIQGDFNDGIPNWGTFRPSSPSIAPGSIA